MQEFDNTPEDEKISRLFLQHLENYKLPKKILKIAQKIDFKGILESFDSEFNNLWNNLSIQKSIKNSQGTKNEYRDQVLSILNQSFFNALYTGIKELEIKQIDFDELNKNIQQDFISIIKNLLKPFDIKNLQVLVLKESKTEEVVASKEIESEDILTKKSTRHLEKKFNPEDIPLYDKIIKLYQEQKKEDQVLSVRQVALEIARRDIGLTDKHELQNFYNRFINYKRKKWKKNSID
jgi:hypothetical protein